MLDKNFPRIKLEYNPGPVEITFDPRKAKIASSILDWNKMSISLLIYICKLNNLSDFDFFSTISLEDFTLIHRKVGINYSQMACI